MALHLPTHWAFKNLLWVGAGTEMRTQYLPATAPLGPVDWVRDQSLIKEEELFNNTLNTFYLLLFGVGHIVRNQRDYNREKPFGLFQISDKGSFISTIPQSG